MTGDRFNMPAGAAESMSNDEQRASADAIRDCVQRLSRPAPGGRRVIERAAIMAEGATAGAILDWLAAAEWVPEDLPTDTETGHTGLHAMRRESQRGRAGVQQARRYLSPRPAAPA